MRFFCFDYLNINSSVFQYFSFLVIKLILQFLSLSTLQFFSLSILRYFQILPFQIFNFSILQFSRFSIFHHFVFQFLHFCSNFSVTAPQFARISVFRVFYSSIFNARDRDPPKFRPSPTNTSQNQTVHCPGTRATYPSCPHYPDPPHTYINRSAQRARASRHSLPRRIAVIVASRRRASRTAR